MNQPIDLLSLGAGVQSSTAAIMASEGIITPMPLCGIFSDTMAEPESVYLWLSFLCGVPVKYKEVDGFRIAYVEAGCYQAGVLKFPVWIVAFGDLEALTLEKHLRKDGLGHYVNSGIPHYSINNDGGHGQGPRQCTHDFKLLPILSKTFELVDRPTMLAWRRAHRPALRALTIYEKEFARWKSAKKKFKKDLGPDPGNAPLKPIKEWLECQADPLARNWIGISVDEIRRVKDALRPWINNYYPLIEMRKSRHDCLIWMNERGLKPPRSACVFCPYHSDNEWRRLKNEEPNEFARAVRFEKLYQAAKKSTVKQTGFVPFLNDRRVPLDQIDFNTEEQKGQGNLFDNECIGLCGV